MIDSDAPKYKEVSIAPARDISHLFLGNDPAPNLSAVTDEEITEWAESRGLKFKGRFHDEFQFE